MRCFNALAPGATLFFFIFSSSLKSITVAGQQYQKSFDPLDYVDPLIGTAAGGMSGKGALELYTTLTYV
jgi:hypothetical protein